MLGLYLFDDGLATDFSGNEQHGTIVNEPDSILSDGVDGAGFFSFDGDAYIDTPLRINPVANPQITMGAWARIPAATPEGVRQVLAHDDGGWDRSIGTDIRDAGDGNGDLTWRWTGFTGNGPLGQTQPVDPTLGEWTFLAAVYDQTAGQMRIHVNEEVYEATPQHGPSSFPLRIGGNPCCGEGWVGDIDNVFVFDEALSLEDMSIVQFGGVDGILVLAERDTGNPEPMREILNVWDFESGTLEGFEILEGDAFLTQPTFEDNSALRDKPSLLQGDYWVGTFEARPDDSIPIGTVQGDGPTGL